MKTEHLELLTSAMEQARDRMIKALRFYWPMAGNADIPEAMLCAYVGCALSNSGFHLYPEIQLRNSAKEKLDLCALSPNHGAVVLLEAKRLWNGSDAASLGRDWERMQRPQLLPCEWVQIPNGMESYACLVGVTWDNPRDIARWWIDSNRHAAPDFASKSPSDWAILHGALRRSARRDALSIGESRSTWGTQYLMYAVIALGLDHWQ